MVDWANLPFHISLQIVNAVKRIEDYFSFIGVCSAWRSVKDSDTIRIQPLLWLLLPQRKDRFETKGLEAAYLPSKSKIIPTKYDWERQFFCLEKCEIYTISLPQISGKKILATKGWFVIISTDRHLSLFHPVTQKTITLPPQTAFGAFFDSFYFPYHYLNKAVLSSSPIQNKDYTLMVIHGEKFRLGFWKPGQKVWAVLKGGMGFKDICYCDSTFYAVNDKGVIFVCDLVNCTVVSLGRIDEQLCHLCQLYLAGKPTENTMLLIVRHGSSPYGRPTAITDFSSLHTYSDGTQVKLGSYRFSIYEVKITGQVDVDLVDGESFVELNDLGGKSLFVGYNETELFQNLEVDHGTVRGNHVYFTEDHFEPYLCFCPIRKECPHSGEAEYGIPHGGGWDMGIYDIKNGIVERFYSLEGPDIFSPVWTVLRLR